MCISAHSIDPEKRGLDSDERVYIVGREGVSGRRHRFAFVDFINFPGHVRQKMASCIDFQELGRWDGAD